jgi:hypothetical protein
MTQDEIALRCLRAGCDVLFIPFGGPEWAENFRLSILKASKHGAVAEVCVCVCVCV